MCACVCVCVCVGGGVCVCVWVGGGVGVGVGGWVGGSVLLFVCIRKYALAWVLLYNCNLAL